jgi:hypothetical protein
MSCDFVASYQVRAQFLGTTEITGLLKSRCLHRIEPLSFRAQWQVPIGRGLRGGIPLDVPTRLEGDSSCVPSGRGMTAIPDF